MLHRFGLFLLMCYRSHGKGAAINVPPSHGCVCDVVRADHFKLGLFGLCLARLDCRVSWVRIPPRAALLLFFEKKSCPGCS